MAGAILFVIAAFVLYFAFGNPVLLEMLIDFIESMMGTRVPR